MRTSDDHVVNLRFKGFSNTIQKNLQEVHMKSYFCDVTLACEDKQINAHQIIISSCSSLLKNILKRNENKNPYIYFRNTKFKDLANVLRYMYQGEVTINKEDIPSFLNFTEDLGLKELSKSNKDGFNTVQKSSNLLTKNNPANALQFIDDEVEQENLIVDNNDCPSFSPDLRLIKITTIDPQEKTFEFEGQPSSPTKRIKTDGDQFTIVSQSAIVSPRSILADFSPIVKSSTTSENYCDDVNQINSKLDILEDDSELINDSQDGTLIDSPQYNDEDVIEDWNIAVDDVVKNGENLSEEELCALELPEMSYSKSKIMKLTENTFRRWHEARKDTIGPIDFKNDPVAKVVYIAKKFLAEVRQINKTSPDNPQGYYRPNSLNSLAFGFRNLILVKYKRNIDLSRAKGFRVVIGKMSKSYISNVGRVTKIYEPISDADISAILNYCSQYSRKNPNPQILIEAVLVHLALTLGARGRDWWRSLRKDSLKFGEDDFGRKYAFFDMSTRDKPKECRMSTQEIIDLKNKRIYESDDGESHETFWYLREYKERTSPHQKAFFQIPRTDWDTLEQNVPLFRNLAMSKNTISGLLPNLSEKICSKRYTMHCFRSSTEFSFYKSFS